MTPSALIKDLPPDIDPPVIINADPTNLESIRQIVLVRGENGERILIDDVEINCSENQTERKPHDR